MLEISARLKNLFWDQDKVATDKQPITSISQETCFLMVLLGLFFFDLGLSMGDPSLYHRAEHWMSLSLVGAMILNWIAFQFIWKASTKSWLIAAVYVVLAVALVLLVITLRSPASS